MSTPGLYTGFSNVTKLTGGRKVVTTGGTREQITSTETAIAGVIIQALRSNSGNVAIGGSDVDVTAGSENGIELVAGQTETIPCRDLSLVWIDADNNGEGVAFSLLFG